MVLDLSRNFNDLIQPESFHMQSMQDAVALSSPGCFYGKLDISDCFLSFPVHPDSQRFLAFELDGTHYRFTRLPFGLSSAPLWTDRFLQCIDFALKQAGLSHVRYCDDFLFVAPTAESLRAALRLAQDILQRHGLVVNPDKTEGPAQSITFLGLGIDSVDQVLFVPDDKVGELLQLAGDMRDRTHTKLRHLQSLIGKFSFAAAVLPGARPFFRRLIDATRGRHKFAPIPLSDDMREDLRSWTAFLKKGNRRHKWVRSDPFVLEHDASMDGFGFLLTAVPQGFDVMQLPPHLRPGQAFAGYYSPEDFGDVARSIQWGEMRAMAVSLAMYAPFLRDSSVLLKTDNLADVHIIRRQSTSSPPLLKLLRYIYAACAHYNIDIAVEHVPGQLNTVPDYLSRPSLHQNRVRFDRNHVTYHTHFIHSSSFRPGTEPLAPPTFSWSR
jgi:hypothetical protein